MLIRGRRLFEIASWTRQTSILTTVLIFSVLNLLNREFKIPRRRRWQRRRLKSDFAIYETLARLSQIGHYVLCRQTLLELNS